MAFTKVVGPGIHTLAQLRTHNIHSAGIITATKFVGEMESGGGDSTFENVTINGNLTVQGDTTTLNTTLRNVELLRVAANSPTTAGIITQTGSGDILNLFDGTTEVMTVVDGGNVGIGLTNPQSNSNLHIKAATVTQLRLETTDNTSYGIVKLVEGDHDGVKDKYIIGYNDSHSAQADQLSLKNQIGDITFMAGGVATSDEKVRIKSDGKVGIGTTNPGAKLDLGGAINIWGADGQDYAMIINPSSGGGLRETLIGKANADLRIQAGAGAYQADRANILLKNSGKNIIINGESTSGFIGIGITEPEALLHLKAANPQLVVMDTDTTEANTSATIRLANASAAGQTNHYFNIKKEGTDLVIDDGQIGSGVEERLRLTSGGNIGIGITNPEAQYFNNLVVGNNSVGDKGITIRTTSNAKGVLAFSDTDSADANRYDGWIGYIHRDQRMVFNTGGANHRMSIDSDGKVGIGITNPAEKFQVNGGNIAITGGTAYKIDTHPLVSYSSFVLDGGNYAARLGSTGTSTIRHTQIYGGGSHIATFDGVNNRLGIGTTAPNETLELFKASGTNLVRLTTQANSTIGIEIQKTGSTTQTWRIADGQSVNGMLQIYDKTDDKYPFNIDTGQRVLLGSTSSRFYAAKLQVQGASDSNYIMMHNTSGGDASGDRYSKFIYSGTQSGGETSDLAHINAAHDGTVDDQKGRIEFRVNTGASNHSPAEVLRITSDQCLSINNSGAVAGTAGTVAQLKINSNGQFDGMMLGNVYTYGIISRGTGDSSGALIYTGNAGAANLGGGVKAAHEWWSGSSGGGSPQQRMTLTAAGRVGIGSALPRGSIDVWGDGSAYPTIRLGTEDYQTDGEHIRFGRKDIGATDIRYHSIHTRHDGVGGGGNYIHFKIHDAGGDPWTSQKTALKIDGLGRVAINSSTPQGDNKLTVRSDNASQSGANEGTVTGALALFYGGSRTTISGSNYLDTSVIHIKGQITDADTNSTGTHTTGKIVFSGRRRYGAQAWIEHDTEWVYNTQNAGSHLKFYTSGLASNGGDESTPGCRLHINKEGKLIHGSGLVSQVYGGGFSISPGTTKTVTISGLISGSYMFHYGTYSSQGQGQGGISFVNSGYHTATFTHDYNVFQNWSNGGGTGISISGITRNASNLTFTVTNSHGSFTAGGSWHLWGNDEITVTVS